MEHQCGHSTGLKWTNQLSNLHLFERLNGIAKKNVEAAIPADIPLSGPQRSRAIAATGALIEVAVDGGWQAVWPAIRKDEAFGKAAIESVAEYNRMNPSIV